MKHFFDNNKRLDALMTILVLAVGSISIVGIGTTHVAMASQIGKLCVFFACGNATINGGTSGGGGGQPTPNTATLTVIKKVSGCTPGTAGCPDPKDFQITVSGVTASPSSFPGDAGGTTVTVSPGTYTVSENTGPVVPMFSGNCKQTDPANLFSATGTISAGDQQTCTITNSAP
jgi:hypothetical protein